MPARKTTTANIAATQAAKLAAAAKAAEAVPVPETPTVLDGVVDKAGTNKTTRKPKPAMPAKAAPKPSASDAPAPAPKAAPKAAKAEWWDVANRPATPNEIARYEWTLKQAKMTKAALPLDLFVLSARAQGPFQKANR